MAAAAAWREIGHLDYHQHATNSPRRSTHLPNDYKLQQDASYRARNSSQATPTFRDTQAAPKKPLEYMSGSQILQKVLGGAEDVEYWRRRIARFRTSRLPVVLLQEIMRQEESASNGSSEIMCLLPTEDEMDRIVEHPDLGNHSREALDYYVYVLRGRDDRERCSRLLERRFLVPQFVFNFLVRPSADFNDTGTLLGMIEACQWYLLGGERAKLRAKAKKKAESKVQEGRRAQKDGPAHDPHIDQANVNLIMRLLVGQCLRLEPRYIVMLADKACRYIECMTSRTYDPWKLYQRQCDAFNECLQIFRPQRRLQTVQRSMPNAYFWEAQRLLLTMSAGLAEPLLVSRAGFRAIRDVLSGQPKNYTERYSAARHAPGWPPYLQPGHGMDELSNAEDNWSRTVSAGMLMQEAGYSKDELDDAVDILQGMAMDGTPTIQQRTAIGDGRNIGIWEASIRATRNAQEAWQRFRNPPEPRLVPGLDQYAAMFEKLMLREVEPESRLLPGDKALNFPTQYEANLAEFERARLRPPSVSELYRDMKLGGLRPDGACLCILVANAESLEMAHQYLRDSPGKGQALENLMRNEPDLRLLMDVPLSLFAAYIQACLRAEGRGGNARLTRAIRLSQARLRGVRSRWMPFVWGIILKDLSQHHRALSISLADQLYLISQVADAIEKRAGLQLSSFTQFNKCVRKAIRREANQLFASDTATPYAGQESGLLKTATTTAALQKVSSRIKTMFWALAERERDAQRLLEPFPIAPLERMDLRRDVVRSDDVYEHMLALGYLGQFDEMARLLDWLIRQWGQPDVVSALTELDEPPPYADFLETLCVFRLVAEPMLGDGVVASLVQSMADSGLEWPWPDDVTLKAYVELHNDGFMSRLWRDRWAGGYVQQGR
ncbi:hypothetical protein E4U41_005350 [Claviceps citrina]|nr:hypothetical protein E4U41_005350 [Claviceps citrina]